ncbi:MAG: bifunctional oligoribonuclease/PAP phosphatase NrnA [Planctomycetota bacterium]
MSVPADVIAALGNATSAIFSSHVPPDGDGLGAAIALVRWFRSTGRRAVFAAGGDVQSCLHFVYEEDEIDTAPAGPEESFDLHVALDAATRARLAGNEPRFAAAPLLVNVDHHVTNENFGHVNWVDPDASSTGEMVYRLLKEIGAPLSTEIAEPLYVAVMTDTGRFSYSNTTPAVHGMAAELLAAGVRPDRATGAIYRSVSPSWLRLTALAVEGMTIVADGRVACITATTQIIERSGADPLDVGDLVSIPISVAGVEVGALFRPADGGGTKISLRSREVFPVNEFAARYGGGGHPRAAGAKVDLPVEEARDAVLAELAAAVAEAG